MMVVRSGGMGLTGGIADVGSLFDALVAMRNGKADDSILDKYSEVRKKKWAEIIDPMSRANFKRVCLDEEAAEREKFWELCHQMEKDDELARQMAQVSQIAAADSLSKGIAVDTEKGTNILRDDLREYLTA